MNMLRIARKKKGLTMKALGQMVGVSESAISQYENGRREADFETLLKISDILECSVDYLLRGQEHNNPTKPKEEDDDKKPAAEAEGEDIDEDLIAAYGELTEENKEIIRTITKKLWGTQLK